MSIEAKLNNREDIPNPATILGASPRNIYDINIETSRNKTDIAYRIIAVIVPSDNLCI